MYSYYLNDGGVIGEAALQRGLRLGRVAHADVLDVAAAEDDVLVDLVSRRHRAVRGAVLRAEGTDCATMMIYFSAKTWGKTAMQIVLRDFIITRISTTAFL